MVDEEYKRLGCKSQECCAISKQARKSCAHCGVEFTPKQSNAIYCGKVCNVRAWRAANPDKDLANKIKSRVQQSRKYWLKKEWFDTVIKPEIDALKRIASYVERPKLFRYACVNCGCQMVVRRTKGGHSRICAKCRKNNKTESKRKLRRQQRAAGMAMSSHRKRARRFGCEFDPKLSKIDVFERDKWTCQLCGLKTPRKLMGKGVPRSPELDHIVPLSRGGGHIWGNVQCSCRKCNIAKGSASMGQLSLKLDG